MIRDTGSEKLDWRSLGSNESESNQSTLAAASGESPSANITNCLPPGSPLRFSVAPENPPSTLLPHQIAYKHCDNRMYKDEDMAREAQDLRLTLETECGQEDSAVGRILYEEMPDERALDSQSDFFIDEAEPVRVDTRY